MRNILESTGSVEEDIVILPQSKVWKLQRHTSTVAMNTKSLPTYRQFKVTEKNKRLAKKKRKKVKAVARKEKTSLIEICEANVKHLGDSHPHLFLHEPPALFRLYSTTKSIVKLLVKRINSHLNGTKSLILCSRKSKRLSRFF